MKKTTHDDNEDGIEDSGTTWNSGTNQNNGEKDRSVSILLTEHRRAKNGWGQMYAIPSLSRSNDSDEERQQPQTTRNDSQNANGGINGNDDADMDVDVDRFVDDVDHGDNTNDINPQIHSTSAPVSDKTNQRKQIIMVEEGEVRGARDQQKSFSVQQQQQQEQQPDLSYSNGDNAGVERNEHMVMTPNNKNTLSMMAIMMTMAQASLSFDDNDGEGGHNNVDQTGGDTDALGGKLQEQQQQNPTKLQKTRRRRLLRSLSPLRSFRAKKNEYPREQDEDSLPLPNVPEQQLQLQQDEQRQQKPEEENEPTTSEIKWSNLKQAQYRSSMATIQQRNLPPPSLPLQQQRMSPKRVAFDEDCLIPDNDNDLVVSSSEQSENNIVDDADASDCTHGSETDHGNEVPEESFHSAPVSVRRSLDRRFGNAHSARRSPTPPRRRISKSSPFVQSEKQHCPRRSPTPPPAHRRRISKSSPFVQSEKEHCPRRSPTPPPAHRQRISKSSPFVQSEKQHCPRRSPTPPPAHRRGISKSPPFAQSEKQQYRQQPKSENHIIAANQPKPSPVEEEAEENFPLSSLFSAAFMSSLPRPFPLTRQSHPMRVQQQQRELDGIEEKRDDRSYNDSAEQPTVHTASSTTISTIEHSTSGVRGNRNKKIQKNNFMVRKQAMAQRLLCFSSSAKQQRQLLSFQSDEEKKIPPKPVQMQTQNETRQNTRKDGCSEQNGKSNNKSLLVASRLQVPSNDKVQRALAGRGGLAMINMLNCSSPRMTRRRKSFQQQLTSTTKNSSSRRTPKKQQSKNKCTTPTTENVSGSESSSCCSDANSLGHTNSGSCSILDSQEEDYEGGEMGHSMGGLEEDSHYKSYFYSATGGSRSVCSDDSSASDSGFDFLPNFDDHTFDLSTDSRTTTTTSMNSVSASSFLPDPFPRLYNPGWTPAAATATQTMMEMRSLGQGVSVVAPANTRHLASSIGRSKGRMTSKTTSLRRSRSASTAASNSTSSVDRAVRERLNRQLRKNEKHYDDRGADESATLEHYGLSDSDTSITLDSTKNEGVGIYLSSFWDEMMTGFRDPDDILDYEGNWKNGHAVGNADESGSEDEYDEYDVNYDEDNSHHLSIPKQGYQGRDKRRARFHSTKANPSKTTILERFGVKKKSKDRTLSKK